MNETLLILLQILIYLTQVSIFVSTQTAMKTLSPIVFLLFFSSFLCGQSDTLFVNTDGYLCQRDQARRFRLYTTDSQGALLKEFDINGTLRIESRLGKMPPSEMKDGLTKEFIASGEKVRETFYSQGMKHGTVKEFYPEGNISFEGVFENDKPMNMHSWYYPDGVLRRKEEFVNGKMSKGYCFTPDGKDTLYYPAEQMAVFPGDLHKYLMTHIKYPKACRKKGIEGKVLLRFIIEKDGSIQACKVIRSIDPMLDEEAVRVVMEMPQWEPARQEGKPVRIEYNLPVNFKLQ